MLVKEKKRRDSNKWKEKTLLKKIRKSNDHGTRENVKITGSEKGKK